MHRATWTFMKGPAQRSNVHMWSITAWGTFGPKSPETHLSCVRVLARVKATPCQLTQVIHSWFLSLLNKSNVPVHCVFTQRSVSGLERNRTTQWKSKLSTTNRSFILAMCATLLNFCRLYAQQFVIRDQQWDAHTGCHHLSWTGSSLTLLFYHVNHRTFDICDNNGSVNTVRTANKKDCNWNKLAVFTLML